MMTRDGGWSGIIRRGEVLARIRQVVDANGGLYVSAEDIIPERTRRCTPTVPPRNG
jgi:hypothetical protein